MAFRWVICDKIGRGTMKDPRRPRVVQTLGTHHLKKSVELQRGLVLAFSDGPAGPGITEVTRENLTKIETLLKNPEIEPEIEGELVEAIRKISVRGK